MRGLSWACRCDVTSTGDPFDADILHASTVALGQSGILILGPSGSGKSALALQLMALGAMLVADDRTHVRVAAGGIDASAPETLRGLIEARGIGILRAPAMPTVRVALAVDLGRIETERMPPRRSMVIKSHAIDLVFGQTSAHFPASLLCLVAGGRHE